jgi:hypothetical protein
MKKFLLSALAVLAVFSASAQGDVDFEMPLFGSEPGEAHPAWSGAALSGLSFGHAHRFDAPARTKSSGMYFDISFCELRCRPWRNGNCFSVGLEYTGEIYRLDRDAAFNERGEIVDLPASRSKGSSTSSEGNFLVDFGYAYEWNRLTVGLFACPGIGYSSAQSRYKPAGTSLRMQQELQSSAAFRLALKAGVWYSNFGFVFGYNFGNVSPARELPHCSSAFIAISIRY